MASRDKLSIEMSAKQVDVKWSSSKVLLGSKDFGAKRHGKISRKVIYFSKFFTVKKSVKVRLTYARNNAVAYAQYLSPRV